jgi:alpha-glucosidase (family GH31 glycosyl hydrolase)
MTKLKNIFITLCLSAIFTSLFSQNSDRKFVSYEKTDKGIEVKTNYGKYLFSNYRPTVIQTTFIPAGETAEAKSHAVIQPLSKEEFKSNDSDSLLILSIGRIDIKIQKAPFQVQYFQAGKKVITEKKGYFKTATHEAINFNINATEILYGGGARALGMNRRGNRLELYNKANYGYESTSALMNFCMPIVMSSEKYMIHFDNPETGFLDLDSKKDNTIAYETTGGNKTYQIIFGNSWNEIIFNYTQLTGSQPLPPRWAFGNFSSRFGYHSQKETEQTVNKFIEDSIPLDAVILDLYWFGKEIQGTMGNLEFYKDSFPTPLKMISDFNQKGIKTVLISEPFILNTSNRWKEAVSKNILAKDSLGNPFVYNFYFGNTGLIDIYSKPGKEWFWDIYKGMHDQGVKGFWGDLGEPEVHPKNLIHAVGKATKVHNIYGHDWAKLIQEGYQKNYPNERPFILMRAGYSGSQRFGMIPWSGDVNRTWGGLQAQPEIALQMGMQGIGYMHSDLGGFAGTYDDNELYIRWLQYGVFQPIFRPHAQEQVASEPVFKDENTKRIVKDAIQLRYDLLPYNYTMAYLNSKYGLPLMRPLMFEENNNPKLLTNKENYLWGNEILVAPILEKGKISQELYFPGTSDWFDFYTGEIHQSGSTAEIKTNMENIPTFVRAGAFIPMSKGLKNTDDFDENKVSIHFYYQENLSMSNGIYFTDDGKTPVFNQGYQSKIEYFRYKKKGESSTISFDQKSLGKIKPAAIRRYEMVLHNVESAPKSIILNKKEIKFQFDKTYKTLTIIANLEQPNSILKINW